MSGWEILVGVLVMASGLGVLLTAKPLPAGWSSGLLALLGGILRNRMSLRCHCH